MGNPIPHVLVIPYPAQGHVIPQMEMAIRLVKHGIRVTFVNTDFNHKRVIKSLSNTDSVPDQIHMVSIPDGLESSEDRNDLGKLTEAILLVMPSKLEALIEKMNGTVDGKVTCLIADESMGWALEVAKKKGIKSAAFWPASAAILAIQFSIPRLLDEGIIDSIGTPLQNHKIQLSPDMPAMDATRCVWACVGGDGDLVTQKIVFDVMSECNTTIRIAEWVICNSSDKLEEAAFSLFPNVLPIGPLLANHRLGESSVGYFWPADSDCLTWLDEQPYQSVIYVAFGSFTVFDQMQFQELALGLELTNMPFIWVVRQDLTKETENAYPTGFRDRIQGRGRLAGWVPQQNVLNHPSIACFITHCGWNSTIEGISNGLPLLCWPYFADQFVNETYICDKWKVGLRFKRNENGIIERGEIKSKAEQLLNDDDYRTRVLCLKEKITNDVGKEGCSGKNFGNFINWIKEEEN